MWNVKSARGSKTLSQFPAAKLAPMNHAPMNHAPAGQSSTSRNNVTQQMSAATSPDGPVPLRRTASALGLPSATVTLSGIPVGDFAPIPVPLSRQTNQVSHSSAAAPWAKSFESLCAGNSGVEWLGPSCAVFCLAEMLCELPESYRLTTSVALTEVNTRGELQLVADPVVEDGAHATGLRDEGALVKELVRHLVTAAGLHPDQQQKNTTLEPSERDRWDASPQVPRPVPEWLKGLATGGEHPKTVAEFAMWLGLQLELPRSEQTEQIRLWVRHRRRQAQSREGMMMEQLGGALTCLSASPQVSKPSKGPSGWVWLSISMIVLGIGAAAFFLLR